MGTPATKAVRARRNRTVEKGKTALAPELPEGMTAKQHAFALAYLANGWKAASAYRETHPDAADSTCWIEGWRLLRNPKVAAFVAEQQKATWKQWEMSAEEAAARVAADARADLGAFYDRSGKLRPLHELPPELRQSIKRVKPGPFGVEVQLNDSLAARRTMLELHGKLHGSGDSFRDLAEILAEKWRPTDREGAKAGAKSEGGDS